MDCDDYDFVADMLVSGLLGSSKSLDPNAMDAYWSGHIRVPAAIESDVNAFLATSDPNRLTRAAVWVAKNHYLSGYRPKHHMSLVRWLFQHGELRQSELVGLVALTSVGGGLDEAGKEIAWIAAEILEEGRVEDEGGIVATMLIAYEPLL
ncbi:hypothetical protein [Stenotrophomonas sp. AB1(2024)]|uniref:hypothetical protein n=1 Tax=Stenotrophomonas sp. AB1(2024) TaxID=3132215 RepID=UPI0030A804BE